MNIQEFGMCEGTISRRVFLSGFALNHQYDEDGDAGQEQRVVQAILYGYLEWARERGFLRAFVILDKPKKLSIFNGNAGVKKNAADRDKLCEWFGESLRYSQEANVVAGVTFFEKAGLKSVIQAEGIQNCLPMHGAKKKFEMLMGMGRASSEKICEEYARVAEDVRVFDILLATSAGEKIFMADPDPVILGDVLRRRKTFLELCKTHHLRWDDPILAKYSTMLLCCLLKENITSFQPSSLHLPKVPESFRMESDLSTKETVGRYSPTPLDLEEYGFPSAGKRTRDDGASSKGKRIRPQNISEPMHPPVAMEDARSAIFFFFLKCAIVHQLTLSKNEKRLRMFVVDEGPDIFSDYVMSILGS